MFFLDFQNKFSAVHQEFSISKSRELKSEVTLSSTHLLSDSAPVHFTSVTDTRRTATIIQRGEYGGPAAYCCVDVYSARNHHHSQLEEHTAHVKPRTSPHFTTFLRTVEFVLNRGLRIL